MRSRKLRIALSAISALACALLIALWHSLQQQGAPPPLLGIDETNWDVRLGRSQFLLTALLPMKSSPYLVNMRTIDFLGFNRQGTRRELLVAIPYWFPIALSATLAYWLPLAMSVVLAAATRIRWHFSLRTLLIATTLVSVVLGLAVYALRK